MAVTMSGATVDQSSRQTLLGQNVEISTFSGGIYGKKLAGITAEFAKAVTTCIDTYVGNVEDEIKKLQGVAVNQAFRGSGIELALNSFVENVENVALNYVAGLKNAEIQIINSVEQVYTTQDSDISGNVKTDGGNLENNSKFSN